MIMITKILTTDH